MSLNGVAFGTVLVFACSVCGTAQTNEPVESRPEQTVAQPASTRHQHTLYVSPSGKTMLAGGIDGAVTPGLISDLAAYRLFMNAVAEPTDATLEQVARERAKLSRADLSDADLGQVFTIFASYQAQKENLASAFRSLAFLASTKAYETQRDGLTAVAMAELKSALSAGGWARLDRLVQGEKRRMTIAPFPKMP